MITINSNSIKFAKNQVQIFSNRQSLQYTTTIHFAKRNWAVIGIGENGSLSLLAIDELKRMPFGKDQFYSTSIIREYCSSFFESMTDKQKSLLLPTLLNDIGVDGIEDHLFILSMKEAKLVSKNLLSTQSFQNSFKTSWLRDLCYYRNTFSSHDYYGYMLDEKGCIDTEQLYNVSCLAYCRLACVIRIPVEMTILNYADLLYLLDTNGHIL